MLKNVLNGHILTVSGILLTINGIFSTLELPDEGLITEIANAG